MSLTRETLHPATEAEWLEMRESDVTSTESPALFGCSPRLTEYRLYHQKTGQDDLFFEETEWMKWGKRMEPTIALGMAEDYGLLVEPFKCYMRIPEIRMGSSFDYKIVGLVEDFQGDNAFRELFREHGPGIMEIKNVMGWSFSRQWIEEDGEIEAPPEIEIQVQHQQEVAGMGWTMLAPFLSGNTPKPTVRLRDREVGALCREKIEAFWDQVDRGIAPDPDFGQDAELIFQQYFHSEDREEDLSANEHLVDLLDEYDNLGKTAKEADARRKAIKAEALTIIGATKKVRADEFTVSASTTKDNPGKKITPDMVGQRIGQRKGYRNFRVTRKKPKAAK